MMIATIYELVFFTYKITHHHGILYKDETNSTKNSYKHDYVDEKHSVVNIKSRDIYE
jgi:hypothetical protein